MRFTESLALLLGLASVEAQFTKPLAGDTFQVGHPIQIAWETAGLKAPINLDLVPGGVTDRSVVAEKIAVGIDNVGRLNWTPDASITAFENFMMVITDAAQTSVVSQRFQISQLTKEPVVQTIVGGSQNLVQVFSAAAAPPKVVYSGPLPAHATPAGLVLSDAARANRSTPRTSTAADATFPAKAAAPADTPASAEQTAPVNATTSAVATAPADNGGRGKGSGRGGKGGGVGQIDETAVASTTPGSPTGAAGGNGTAAASTATGPTGVAGGNGTDAAPSPIFSTIPTTEAPKTSAAPLEAPTSQAAGNGTDAAPSPIYSTIPDTPKSTSAAAGTVPTGQVGGNGTEAAPSPIYSTIVPDPAGSSATKSFPTLPPATNQTAPAVEAPVSTPAPTTEQSRVSIVPSATLPAVLLPPQNTSAPVVNVPANSSIPAAPPAISTAPTLVPPVNSSAPAELPLIIPTTAAPANTSAAAVLPPVIPTTEPVAVIPANPSSPSQLPALPVTEPAAVVPVPLPAAPSTTLERGAGATEVPAVAPPAAPTSLPTLTTSLAPANPVQSSSPALSSSALTSSSISIPSSDIQPRPPLPSGSDIGTTDGTRDEQTSSSTSPVSSASDDRPTAIPQVANPALPATGVPRIGPSVSLPSSLVTSMVLATGFGVAAPTAGLSFATAAPGAGVGAGVVISSSVSTWKTHSAAVAGGVAALVVAVVM
ncbi:hypothetical protein C8035_v000292 [Colletotrichum spinosum]|uniref:Yeast cell wall synthesis Kre9/Knh1-like N-terminal domain-containing protein n=1 Tax=Colletotrichum spinosum TaxID=1347390 RepID=A0A4R8PXB9_9PEZI|nr:hypothetical protein C8035_v000292 [Colletotrichum spinosum]